MQTERYTCQDLLNANVHDKLGLKKNGKQYEGPCPICGGKDRFHFKNGNDGFAHVYCRYGCTQSDIWKQLHDLNLLPKKSIASDVVKMNDRESEVKNTSKHKPTERSQVSNRLKSFAGSLWDKAGELDSYDQSNTDSKYQLKQSRLLEESRRLLFFATEDFSTPDSTEPTSKALTLKEFLNLEQPPELISNLAPAVGVGFIHGKTGSGKSMFMLALARACQNGWHIDQFKWNRTGKTLFVMIEDCHGFAKRWNASNQFFNDELDAEIFHPADTFVLDSGDAPIDLIEVAPPGTYSQIVIETYSLAKGRYKENDNDDTALAIKELYRIARKTESFVWVSHHSGHGEQTRERGASAMRANVDVSIGLQLDGNDMRVEIAKNKLGPQDIKFYLQLSHKNSDGNFHTTPCIDPRQQSGNLKKLAKSLWEELQPDAQGWWTRVDSEFPEGQRPSAATKSKWFKEFSGETFRKFKATQDSDRKVSISQPLKGCDGNSFESNSTHWQERE